LASRRKLFYSGSSDSGMPGGTSSRLTPLPLHSIQCCVALPISFDANGDGLHRAFGGTFTAGTAQMGVMQHRALFPVLGFKGKQAQLAGRNAPATASAARSIYPGKLGWHVNLMGFGTHGNHCSSKPWSDELAAIASMQLMGLVLFQICNHLNTQGVVTAAASLQLIAKPFQIVKLFDHFAACGWSKVTP